MSGLDERSAAMIEAAYEAAGPHGDWAAFLRHVLEATGTRVALFAHFGVDHERPLIEQLVGLSPLWTRRFNERFAALNPYSRAPAAAGMGSGALFHVDEVLQRREVMKTEFYADFVRPSHTSLESLVAIPVREAAAYSGLALIAGAGDGDAAIERARPAMRAVLPHLRQALRLHHQLSGLKQLHGHLLDGFDVLGSAVLLCDASGKIHEMSALADAMLREFDGIAARAGKLCFELSHVQRRVSLALRLATGSSTALPPDIIRVPRRSGRRDYELRVFRLPRRHRPAAMAAPLAMMIVLDPSRSDGIDYQALGRAFSLTPAEVNVLRQVVTQVSRRAIAERLGVSDETVKSHLKALFQKSGTNRRSALVAWVLTSSARISGSG